MPWLQPRSGKILYRGAILTDESCCKKAMELFHKSPNNIQFAVNYVGHTEIQSWSNYKTVAEKFQIKAFDLQKYAKSSEGLPCILQTTVQENSNFFFPDEILYSAAAVWDYLNESETIHVGFDKLHAIAHVDPLHVSWFNRRK